MEMIIKRDVPVQDSILVYANDIRRWEKFLAVSNRVPTRTGARASARTHTRANKQAYTRVRACVYVRATGVCARICVCLCGSDPSAAIPKAAHSSLVVACAAIRA